MNRLTLAVLLYGLRVLADVPDAGASLVASRPYRTVLPDRMAGDAGLPALILLHGLGSSAAGQEEHYSLSAAAKARGFVLALPEGTKHPNGHRFWNATDACCGFGAQVDDVTYLTAVIADLRARFSIDPKRVFVAGHSNGGFMALRMACERSELIAGVISVAGAGWSEASKCTPTRPVNVLQVHGTRDSTIHYGGGTVRGITQPGAEKTLAMWAASNRCSEPVRKPAGVELDLVSDLPGAETQREATTGCPPGGAVELWRIREGVHMPAFGPAFAGAILDWLLAHPKPLPLPAAAGRGPG